MEAEDSPEGLAAVLPARAEWEAFTVEAASIAEEAVMLAEAAVIVVAEAVVVTTEQ
jgi:hypothetical protein